MSAIRHVAIGMTTNAGGAATVYTNLPADGELLAIRLLLGTLTSGCSVTITDDASGMALLTVASLTANTDYFPRGAAVNPANAAITNSFVKIPLTGKVKAVVAGGGNVATGTLHIWWKG